MPSSRPEAALPHLLERPTELCYILKGLGEIHNDNEAAPVAPGQIILIPPHARQWIRNTGRENLVFLCIVSPKWQSAEERLVM